MGSPIARLFTSEEIRGLPLLNPIIMLVVVLAMVKKYSHESIVPCKQVDELTCSLGYIIFPMPKILYLKRETVALSAICGE